MNIQKQQRLNVFFKISWFYVICSFIILFGMLTVYFYVDEATYQLMLRLLIIFSTIVVLVFLLSVYWIGSIYKKGRINKTFSIVISKVLRIIIATVMNLATIFDMDKNILRSFFIDINNIIVDSIDIQCEEDKILLLIPHCLQWINCGYKVTSNPINCKRCGRCDIGEILNIAENKNIRVCIASGGTMARRAVWENKPEVIISVACNRDLMSGILDIGNIPVIAIENRAPEGACINTQVDIWKIEKAIEKVIIKKDRD